MSDLIVARDENDPLGGIETILQQAQESFVAVGVDIADYRLDDRLEDREAGVIVARFNADDLVSLKAMQTLQTKRPGMGVIFVTPNPLPYEIVSLLFNEGAFGVITEPVDPTEFLSLLKKGIKRSDWKRESLSENIELKRLNARLTDRLSWFEGESGRNDDLRQKLENLVHYLLTEPGFKTSAIKILVVSGSSYQKGMLTETLGRIGFTIKSVPHAEEALEVIKTYRPQVVVSDLELSGINGVELAKEVKGSADYPQLHFIILTSSVEKRNWILTPDTRVDDCIIKPSDAVKFKDMVARIALGILAA